MRDLNLWQVAEDIASGNVEGTAERNREVGEVPAHSISAGVNIGGRGPRVASAVLELEMIMNVIADGLHPPIARRRVAEAFPGLGAEHVWQAEAAGKNVDQRLVGELIWGYLGHLLVDILYRVRRDHG